VLKILLYIKEKLLYDSSVDFACGLSLKYAY